MGSYRKFLPPYTDPLFNASSIAGNVTGTPVNISYYDLAAIQFGWTGTPTGTWQVQASVDYNKQLNTGTWNAIPGLTYTQPSGAAGSFILPLAQLAVPWIRVAWTAATGAGTGTVIFTGKGA